MKIIAFGHQKRVGKDTACGYIATHLRVNKGYRRVVKAGFADKVKSQCYELFAWAGLQPKDFYDDPCNAHLREEILPLIGKSPRRLWIDHGMSARNNLHSEVWVNFLLHEVKCDFLIVSDMRFPNEAQRIKELGGLVIKIERPSIPHTSDEADDPLLNYKGWDDVIVNDNTLKDFHDKVINVVDKYASSNKYTV